jgi:glycosyltransferase involved in cell wall biosynthesis
MHRGLVTASPDAPVVSIITPTYNHERYIRTCIESALAQTDPRWEQFVVDDGSADGTEAIAREFDDPRITYIRLPHRGIMHLAESYNLALERSRGEFIGVLEGDDWWPADKIERQLGTFTTSDIVLSYGIVAITNEAGEVIYHVPSQRVAHRTNGQPAGEALRDLLRDNYIPAGSVMVRRDALIRAGGFCQPDDVPTTDYPTWLELCRLGRFSATTEMLGYQRQHADQVTTAMRKEMDFALDWGPRFVARLPAAEREALGVTTEEARQIQLQRHAHLAYQHGRAALRVNDDALARARFREAFRGGELGTRVRATIGFAAAALSLDLDRAVDMAHRVLGR